MKSAMRFIPKPIVTLVNAPCAFSNTFKAAPILANANRDFEFPEPESCPGIVPGVVALAMETIGVNENSLCRYIPRPAGLRDIDTISAPNEVKAPPMAIDHAVPKFCGRDNAANSPVVMISWLNTAPPNS